MSKVLLVQVLQAVQHVLCNGQYYVLIHPRLELHIFTLSALFSRL